MFNLKLTSDQQTTTSTLDKSSVQINEFQQTLKKETEVVFAVHDSKETVWTDKVVLSPYGSSSLKTYISDSLEKNGVPTDEIVSFLSELFEAQPKQEQKKIVAEPAPIEELEQVEKIETEVHHVAAQAGKKTIGVIASWKVVLIVILLPLIYLSALFVLFTTLHFQNVWLIGLSLIVSGFILLWYLSKVIKSSQRKVLEKTITKEVFLYVGQEQLKQRQKVAKQLQVYDDLFGNTNLKRLATADGVQAAEQLLGEMAVLQDESTL
ncbi:UbiA family prenyltransferase [Lactococcus kimchii]|uniref:UbiA family prenyltransferase n=1 Tax=Lactococcus sp. S-13 TaxID=2507158 RepID=UPI0010236F9B|nr:UbiA family prenyltransferase [Lactococcus sp. S-13]RZI47893.1 hypothetical protein EQJ87_10760 [Lactococcus sp. S-13]